MCWNGSVQKTIYGVQVAEFYALLETKFKVRVFASLFHFKLNLKDQQIVQSSPRMKSFLVNIRKQSNIFLAFLVLNFQLINNSGKEVGRGQGDPAIKDWQAGGQVARQRNRNSKIVKGMAPF